MKKGQYPVEKIIVILGGSRVRCSGEGDLPEVRVCGEHVLPVEISLRRNDNQRSTAAERTGRRERQTEEVGRQPGAPDR